MKNSLIAVVLAVFAGLLHADIHSVGVNVHVPSDDLIDAAWDMAADWIRIDNNWFMVEQAQGVYDWTQLDQVVDRAVVRGRKVFMTIAYTPAWASRGDGEGDGSNNDVPSGDQYAAYVAAAVGHFKDRVSHYGLWNEPNLGGFWEGTAQEYVDKIVKPGSDAIHAACPACKAIGPDLAHVGEYDDYMNDVLGAAKDYFDIISHHIYQKFTENGQSELDGDTFLNALEFPRFGGIGQREALYPLLLKYYTAPEVWISETGLITDAGVSEYEQQRIFVRRVLEEQEKRLWWTVTFFYEIEDCGIPIDGCGIDGYGLLRRLAKNNMDDTFHDNFTFKPAFCEIKNWAFTKGWGLPMTAACPPVTSEPAEWPDDPPVTDDDMPVFDGPDEETDDEAAFPDEDDVPDEATGDDDDPLAADDAVSVPDDDAVSVTDDPVAPADEQVSPDDIQPGGDDHTVPENASTEGCGCSVTG